MRKKLLSILALLCLTVSSAWADGSWTSGDCTVTLSGGVLTVSGSGAMDNYISDSPWSNSSITSIVIEAGVTHIGDFAFSGCNNASLTSVTIPASVKEIGSYAFQKCTSLTTVDIAVGSSLTTIGASAFRYCSGLTSFTIPVTVTTIYGWDTFADCTSLKDVYCYAAPFTAWEVDDYSFSAPTKFHVLNASAWSANYNPDNVEFVGDLSSITGYCGDPSVNSGKDVTWTLTNAGVLTISGTGDMEDFNSEVSPWEGYRGIITSIFIMDGVTSIGYEAFYGCEGLTSITIPNSVTSIGDYAFEFCEYLTEVTIGSGVTSIGDYAFYGCVRLKTITVSGGTNLKVVNGVLFTYDGKLLIKYPAGKSGDSYTIPDGVETIGVSAFDYAKNLTTVTIPNSVKSIGDDAFYDCDNLTTISIPNSVTTIGDYVFSSCNNLTTFNIGSGVERIGDGPCEECSLLTTITVSGGTNFKVVDGVLFTYDGTRLIQYPLGSTATSYEIPAGVKTIGASAFDNAKNLTEVTFPASLTTIGIFAFYQCNGLTTISIPASVTSIDEGAFNCCENLTTVTLNSYPYIGWDAFDIDGYGATPALTMNLTANAAGGAKWMTFYNDIYSFKADANTQVFKAELIGTTITLHEVEDKIVNAYEPVILKTTGGSNPVMTLTTSASGDEQANSLIGVYNPEGEMSDGCFYVLNNGSKGVGFYKLADDKKLGYGKAFLRYDGGLAPGFFGFDGDATGIKTERPTPDPSLNGGEWYDLSGRKLDTKPTKGLYINGGRKVVVK